MEIGRRLVPETKRDFYEFFLEVLKWKQRLKLNEKYWTETDMIFIGFQDAKLDEMKRNKREGMIEMADGSLLLDVCLSQQEQWMKDEVEMESGLLDVCL